MDKKEIVASSLKKLNKLLDDLSSGNRDDVTDIICRNARTLIQEIERQPEPQTIDRLNRLLAKLRSLGLDCPNIPQLSESKVIVQSAASGQFSESKKGRAVEVLSMMSGPRDQCKFCGEKIVNCTCLHKSGR